MILEKAQEKIDRFNKLGAHYNIVADYVYKKRILLDELFGVDYLPFIVAALISFDLARMMGKGAERKYDILAGGFATLLHEKLYKIKPIINHLIKIKLVDVDLLNEKNNIESAYNELCMGGKSGLNQKSGEFHVGATKILHFLNPELFIIVDSNAARAFSRYHGVSYRDTTQPGYTSSKYFNCMAHARTDIIDFGELAFSKLEEATPMARIYDKLTFATGSNWP